MKYVPLIAATLLVVGCDASYRELSYPARPAELADCKVFNLNSGRGGSITVVRCPNSSTTTTYTSGKTTHSVAVIEQDVAECNTTRSPNGHHSNQN